MATKASGAAAADRGPRRMSSEHKEDGHSSTPVDELYQHIVRLVELDLPDPVERSLAIDQAIALVWAAHVNGAITWEEADRLSDELQGRRK